MRKNMIKMRVGAAVMAICMLTVMPMSAYARTAGEVQAEQAKLEQEKQELQTRLDSLKDDEAQKAEYQKTLGDQISVVQSQIDTARTGIEEMNKSINELTKKIGDSQKEIEDTLNLFKERLKALYTAGDISTLQILLDSNSFTDFSMRTQAIDSMTKRDQQIMEEIKANMEKTKTQRHECEAQKQEVAALKKGLESKQAELDLLYEQNEAAIVELQDAQSAAKNAIAENEVQGQACIDEMASIIAAQKAAEEEAKRQQEEMNNNGGGGGETGDIPTGGSGGVEGFHPVWPMPGVTYISQYYGEGGHKGLDIAGSYGTPIVAAESGQVLVANNYDDWGDSWGYYVLIYHNGTFTTRYAHMSSMIVSNGQSVSAGQVIGYEGSTGNSSGPHLHFEVYQDGVRVDPMAFL